MAERGGKEEEGQVRVNSEEWVVRGVSREKTGNPTTGGPVWQIDGINISYSVYFD